MITKQDASDVLSIFHDGTISKYSGDRNKLTLTIDCQYLAELIDSKFHKFSAQITLVEELSLRTWPQNKSASSKTLTDLSKVFQAELEILNVTKNEKGEKVLNCLQPESKFNYSGGELIIVAAEIQVFDQAGREMNIEQLLELAEKYWKSTQ